MTLTETPPAAPPPTPAAQPQSATPARRRHSYPVLLLIALAAAFTVRLAFAATDNSPSTDETAYLRSGLSIWDGDGFRREGHSELHFPPLLPFVLGGVNEITGDPHTATVVVTLITGTLLVLPLAAIARAAAGDRAGLATAWVVALSPGLTGLIVTRGGGSEAPYILMVAMAAWCAVVAARTTERRWQLAAAAGTGAFVGLAYLTRPEGLLLGGVLFAFLVGTALGGWRALRRFAITRANLRSAALVAVAFALPLSVLAAPYVSYLHDKTGKLQLTAKTNDASIEAWRAVAEGDRRARDAVFYRLDEEGTGFVAERYSLMTLVKNDPDGYLGIVGVNVRRLFDTVVLPRNAPVPAWQLLPLPLTALGLWAAWRGRRNRIVLLTLAVGAVPLATSLAFFVQPRYLVPPTALLCVLVGIGFSWLSIAWRRVFAAGGAVLIVFSLAMEFEGDGWFHPREHVEHKAVGEWLNEHLEPDERIMTRSMVVEFYADREAVAMPYSGLQPLLRFAHHHGVRYLVADEYQLRSYRPQLGVLFEDGPWPGLHLVYEREMEGRLVRVFAVNPEPLVLLPGFPPLGFVGDD